MPSAFSSLPQQALQIWERVPRAQKIALAGIGGLAIAMFVFFLSSSSGPAMVTLYSGLEPEDAGAVTSELESLGIKNELASGGSAIKVQADHVDKARIEMAQKGLPQGGAVGFEIFDRTNFGVTDFAQRVNFQRGLEGELARTIRQMAPIDGARVHIVLPARQVFTDSQKPTTASVVLKLKPGRQLEDSQARAIAYLVTHSVEGLKQEDLTIVDTSGKVLFDGSDETLVSGLSGNQFQAQRTFEQSLERDTLSMLERTLGPNKAAVQVRADLNFDRIEENAEIYKPDQSQGTPRSQHQVQETFQGDSANAGAVPGVVANVPGQAAIPGAGTNGNSQYQRSETTTNFELNRTTQKIVRAPGAIKRLSVAVLLDESVPEAQLQALTQSITAATGVDTQRGDQITVSRIPFDTTAIKEAEAAISSAGAQDAMFTYLRLALPVLAVLAAFIFFLFLRRSLRKAGAAWMYTSSVEGAQALQAGGLALPGGGMMALPGGQGVGMLGEPSEENRRREVVNQRVSTLARTQPEAVAEVLQTWLKEE